MVGGYGNAYADYLSSLAFLLAVLVPLTIVAVVLALVPLFWKRTRKLGFVGIGMLLAPLFGYGVLASAGAPAPPGGVFTIDFALRLCWVVAAIVVSACLVAILSGNSQ